MPGSADLGHALAGHASVVAPSLLDGILRHGEVALRITEVEAYGGADDPGSHAAGGQTKRNNSMFGVQGTLYVYFTYGMHHCANVVCGPEGQAGAVLIRGGEVIEGLAIARARRSNARADRDLARGPARLCVALGIDLRADGTDLEDGPVTLALAALGDDGAVVRPVASGPRVGLRQAPDRAWRHWLVAEPTVSNYRAAAPRTGVRSG